MTVSGNTRHTWHQHLFFYPQIACPISQTCFSYGQIVCNIHPQKEEIYRTQLMVGRNRIHIQGNNKSTSTADLLTAELLIHSTIAHWAQCSLASTWPAFTSTSRCPSQNTWNLRLDIISKEIIVKYNLRDLVDEEGMLAPIEPPPSRRNKSNASRILSECSSTTVMQSTQLS